MSDEYNEIKKAMDEIEPSAEAKERMLANIRRKASKAEPEKKKKTVSIYRYVVPVVAAAAVAVIGFGVWKNQKPITMADTETTEEIIADTAQPVTKENITQDDETVEIIPEIGFEGESGEYNDAYATPYKEVDSAAELSSVIGFDIDVPEQAECVVYSSFMDDTAFISFEYDFGGDYNGYYVLQAGKNIDYINPAEGNEIETMTIDGTDVQMFTGEDQMNYYTITWEKDGRAYYLYGWADYSDPEYMIEIYRNIK